MIRASRWLAVAVAAAAFAACHPGLMRFPHTAHLDQRTCGGPGQPDCPTCVTCHDSAPSRKQSLAPEAKDCAPCHQQPDRLVARVLEARSQGEVRHAKLGFSHPSHLALASVKGQCVTCHAGVLAPDEGARTMPPMATCLRCHQADFDRARCTPCHDRTDLGQLVPRSFMRHDSVWARRHGPEARSRQGVCQQCHSESQCVDCHDADQGISRAARRPDAVGARLEHRGDFLSRHAIEARSEGGTCLKCHASSQCDACHVERGVSALARGSSNPHPAGWLGRDTRSSSFHGRAARRDVTSCAACHDHGPATNCIQCHRVGGPGGSPHPGEWDSSRSTDSVPCRYCHEN